MGKKGRGAANASVFLSDSEPMENNRETANKIGTRLTRTLPESWEKAIFHRENEGSEWIASYFFRDAETGKNIEELLPLDEEFQMDLGRLTIISPPLCDVIFFSNGTYNLRTSRPDIPDIEPLSIREIQEKINELRIMDLETADIDDLTRRFDICCRGYRKEIKPIPTATRLYRGVKWNDRPQNVDQLRYPPKDKITKYHRAGRQGQPVFYCSSRWSAPLYELKVNAKDNLAISTWMTTAPLWVNNVGYDAEVLRALGSSRTATSLGKVDSEVNIILNRLLSECFARDIPEGLEYLYKLSIAIAESHFKSDTFKGLLYPSIAMWGNADNLALTPSFVDNHLRLQRVEYIHVDEVIDNRQYKFRLIDFANSFNNDGYIKWKGPQYEWVVRKGESICVSVEDGRWVARNAQGDIVEPEYNVG